MDEWTTRLVDESTTRLCLNIMRIKTTEYIFDFYLVMCPIDKNSNEGTLELIDIAIPQALDRLEFVLLTFQFRKD